MIWQQHKDRKHWEIGLSRWRMSRWCIGAPCHLTKDQSHPIRIWRIRRRAA